MRILLHRLNHFSRLKCRGFQHRSRDVSFVRVARQAGDHAARILLPIRRVQPGKCRNEIDTAIVVDRSRQRLDIGTLLNHSEVVAKPLYQRSGNRHAAFQSVACGAIAKFVPDSGEEAKTRRHQPLARVHQQKATCAVGVLDLARTKTRLAD